MADHPIPEDIIPRRVREERQRRGWTLDQLAARAEVSRAMISKIERGGSSPTAVLLARLGAAMGLSLSALMSERCPAKPALRLLQDQPQWTDPATGYIRRLVSPSGQVGDVEIVAIELPAGAAITFAPSDTLRSDEQVLLLEGQLRFEGGDSRFELHPGDCARVPTEQDHTFSNPSDVPARYLIVKRDQPNPLA